MSLQNMFFNYFASILCCLSPTIERVLIECRKTKIGEFKRQIEQERKQNWTEKKMYGQFVREMPENVDRNKTWQWLSNCDLKIGTEALLCAAQEQAIRTNYVKHYIDKTGESPLCRLCGKKCERVQHLVCGCEKLAQKEYKRRHDNVAKKVHWDSCKKNGLEYTEK